METGCDCESVGLSCPGKDTVKCLQEVEVGVMVDQRLQDDAVDTHTSTACQDR